MLVSPDLKEHFKADPSDGLLDKDREKLQHRGQYASCTHKDMTRTYSSQGTMHWCIHTKHMCGSHVQIEVWS